jgi:hypothetical protein
LGREMVATAIVAAIGIASFGAQAADKLTLKSVTVDLPAGDRMFPEGPDVDAANNNCLACPSAGMILTQPALRKAMWAAEIDKMRNIYKAPIDAKDVDAILDYLDSIKGAK